MDFTKIHNLLSIIHTKIQSCTSLYLNCLRKIQQSWDTVSGPHTYQKTSSKKSLTTIPLDCWMTVSGRFRFFKKLFQDSLINIFDISVSHHIWETWYSHLILSSNYCKTTARQSHNNVARLLCDNPKTVARQPRDNVAVLPKCLSTILWLSLDCLATDKIYCHVTVSRFCILVCETFPLSSKTPIFWHVLKGNGM